MYIYEQDPGHGWLQVPRGEIERLGLSGKITSFSYQNGDYVYLEEDLDMPAFMKAKREAGEPVPVTERYVENTSIRGYQPYSCD